MNGDAWETFGDDKPPMVPQRSRPTRRTEVMPGTQTKKRPGGPGRRFHAMERDITRS